MLEPMLASLLDAPLNDPQLVYEPKYDGIRAIAEVERERVRLWSRLGNEKTNQFPEVTSALRKLARALNGPVVLDGEIVALDANGEPTGFQQLQGRIHVLDPSALVGGGPAVPSRVSPSSRGASASRASDGQQGASASFGSDGPRGSKSSASRAARAPSRVFASGRASEAPKAAGARDSSRTSTPAAAATLTVAYIVFDLLRVGDTDLRDLPLVDRRNALERLLTRRTNAVIRLSRQVRGDARALYDEAKARGWEGLIAKQSSSLYKSGKRTPDWRKLKIVHEQEFVVGGWTEPRNTRSYFGALLLGVYDGKGQNDGTQQDDQRRETTDRGPTTTDQRLTYVGHTGTGFNERELARVMKLLKPREIRESPFRDRLKSNERPHWVKPELVAQVRFSEWTSDGKLRHPVYLGLRDDKKPEDVRREDPANAASDVATASISGAQTDGTTKPVSGAKTSTATNASRAGTSATTTPRSTSAANPSKARATTPAFNEAATTPTYSVARKTANGAAPRLSTHAKATKKAKAVASAAKTRARGLAAATATAGSGGRAKGTRSAKAGTPAPRAQTSAGVAKTQRGPATESASARSGARGGASAGAAARSRKSSAEAASTEGVSGSLVDQLEALERARQDGVLRLPDGDTLPVTNLHKLFWPKLGLTKGELFRYYARVAPTILPVLADRPLVMKRFPNGVAAKPFYQHRAPDVPPGVGTAELRIGERRTHVIGGSLKTLMYTTQLAAISQDPWFSRVPHPEFADHVALDLDPSEGVPFRQVLDVACWIRDELALLGATGWPKTSGADGLHVYVPLPPQTPYDAGLLFCQIVATVVAHKHPRQATVERSVGARGRRVYVDFLQNILGKTLASAYSARASDYAGVSTPLSWKEVDEGVERKDFTILTMPARLQRVGDLWAGLRKSKGIDLERVTRYMEKHG